MQNKLRIILFGVLFLSAIVLSSFMALPASAASTASLQTPTISRSLDVHGVVQPLSQRDYIRGYRDGYNTAVRDCRFRRDRGRFHRRDRREGDYLRGWIDGYNYARNHDRTCRYRRR